MEHSDQRRLQDLTERMITFVFEGDDESVQMLWNSLTVVDQRVIVRSLLAEVAALRGGSPLGARRPWAA